MHDLVFNLSMREVPEGVSTPELTAEASVFTKQVSYQPSSLLSIPMNLQGRSLAAPGQHKMSPICDMYRYVSRDHQNSRPVFAFRCSQIRIYLGPAGLN